ncbi:MAG: ABC transporter permease [Devosia sp.]|nr:ABC transporter permease [Devosia sp.]
MALTDPQDIEIAPGIVAAPADAAESPLRLMLRKLGRHRLAQISGVVLLLLYLGALLAEFIAPADPNAYAARYTYAPPQTLELFEADSSGSLVFSPHVNGYKVVVDPVALKRQFTVDAEKTYPVRLFVETAPYRLLGVITLQHRLIGPVDQRAPFYLLGADRLGRDMLSRLIHGARISLSIGLTGVALSLVIGVVIGGISGYLGGRVDMVIQRIIEFIWSMPQIPLWLGFAAAVPREWTSLQAYFVITVILALIGWTELARVVRGRVLALKTEDFVAAARLDGAGEMRIILRHIVPSFASHIIAVATLAIPGMILAETTLSFLGLGLQAPVVSWGVLLREGQNLRTIATAPWLLAPGFAVILTVLALNFFGDGLRDAADPYS